MKKNKIWLWIFIIIISFNINNIFSHNKIDLEQLTKIELAVTNYQKARGLMYRDNLCESCAMLFIFNDDTNTMFWMKNTFIALDIIFIDNNGKIITIHHNTQPENTRLNYAANSSYRYVLETNAGFAKKNDINQGDVINLEHLLSKGVSYGD